jgi:hypothetical protein
MKGTAEHSVEMMAGIGFAAAGMSRLSAPSATPTPPVKRRPGRPKIERVPETGERWLPPVVTVFRGPQGGLHHTRCRQRIDYRGTRGGLELDFYCVTCREHVTLPEGVLRRVPTAQVGVTS